MPFLVCDVNIDTSKNKKSTCVPTLVAFGGRGFAAAAARVVVAFLDGHASDGYLGCG